MPSSRNRPLTPSMIAEARKLIKSLREIPNFAPHNPAHTYDAMVALEVNLDQAQDELHHARLIVEAARNKMIEAAWMLHDGALGVKAEAVAQFGPDSPVITTLGLVRKSARKRPTRSRVAK